MIAFARFAVCLGVAGLLPAAFSLSLAPSRLERAARILQLEGQRSGSAELLQLGNQARQPDEMEKVKKMITHMIVQHQTALSEDTSHKAFCDKEMAASKTKVKKLKTEIQKRTADRDLHAAQLGELKDKIGDLHEEVAQAHKDRQKAAKLREDEAAKYEKNKRDWDATLQELRRKRRTDSEKVRKAVEKEEEDLMLKKVHAEDKEEDKKFRYKKLDGELAEAIARKTREVELKEHKVVSMTHESSQADGDFKIAQEEQAAAKDYMEKIKSSCIVRQDPAKERKRSREQEISSLKEAYSIMSGDDFAVR